MGNMIVACILIAFVVIFTCVNSYIVCNICDEMIKLIDSGKTEEAIAMWEEKKSYLSLIIRDSEIDVVSAEAELLGESISFEDGEAEQGRMRFREAISELINSEKPSFQNIFVIDIKL